MKVFQLFFLTFIVVSCSNLEEKIQPTEKTLLESVYSSVIIQPDSMYQVFAVVNGILDNNLVSEGDLVVKNQPLLQIINTAPQLNLANAKLSLELAENNYKGKAALLETLKDEIEAALLTYKSDSINYRRQLNLWKNKIGSNADFDAKKLKYQLSKTKVNLLKNKYIQTKNQLNTSLKQAKNKYKTAKINSKDFTVRSKINGKVYELIKEPGEIVNTQEPLVLVGSKNSFIIEMLIDEVDIIKITKEMQVIINLEAYNEKVFTGIVTKIYPKKDERNQTFKVEAVFENMPKKLYPGLSGEANIIIQKKEKVLTIPKDYITNTNEVKTENGYVKVELGIQNMEFVEILSGITKDTYLYKSKE